MSTGKIAWQNEHPKSCYSGTVTTAGGLLFVGQNNGDLVAYDSETGKELWSFQTGAGANTTVTVFEDEGEEKVAIYAGGNSLAATSHGENFWVFSLERHDGRSERPRKPKPKAPGTPARKPKKAKPAKKPAKAKPKKKPNMPKRS